MSTTAGGLFLFSLSSRYEKEGNDINEKQTKETRSG